MTKNESGKIVAQQTEWHAVAAELESEDLKLMSYDRTLLDALGNVQGKRILDYGCGPGVLAAALSRLGADVKGFDINAQMRELAGLKLGSENVFIESGDVPSSSFDVVICNLVLCIVSEEEVVSIVKNIRRVLSSGGQAFIGFCNPKIHCVAESQLDFRYFTGKPYKENHSYRKIKKEGIYEILEQHRPVEWYAGVFQQAGLALLDVLLTPEYELREHKIRDFVICKLE